MRTFCVSQTRSAMSVAVTAPKSVPVSPAGASKRSSAASSFCAISCGCSELCASWRAGFAPLRQLLRLLEALRLVALPWRLVLAQLRDLGRGGRFLDLARQQVVAR